MRLKKTILTAYIIFLAAFCSFAQLKVACIGNSITYGHGIENREEFSYPAQLGKLLGANYDVKNFGVSGATLLKKGDKPYWQEQAFSDAKLFNPNIVIIKLGTNDTKPQNWEYKNEFIDDYTAFIDEFKELSSNPTIYICLPAPAYGIRWNIRDSVINADIIPMVKKIAELNHVKLIDLNSVLSNHIEWFPDLIHPNIEGAGQIAKVIYDIITEQKK